MTAPNFPKRNHYRHFAYFSGFISLAACVFPLLGSLTNPNIGYLIVFVSLPLWAAGILTGILAATKGKLSPGWLTAFLNALFALLTLAHSWSSN